MFVLRPNGHLVAAVQLDSRAFEFVKAAIKVAEKLQSSLDLVHVIEPVNDYYIGSLYGVSSLESELICELERDRLSSGERALKDLMERVNSKSIRKSKVIVGSPDVSVLDYAKLEKADGVVIGASSGAYGFLPSRFSNAISMIRDAFCPVIVLPPKVSVGDSHQNLGFMLADDLSEASKPAVVFAHRLHRSYPRSMVWHAHVVRDDLDLDSEGFLKALGKKPDRQILEERLSSQLSARFGLMDEISKGDGPYEACVRFGDIPAELSALAQLKSPDFIVFGPHHAFKLNPFGFGAMSWTEILHSSKPVILVPS